MEKREREDRTSEGRRRGGGEGGKERKTRRRRWRRGEIRGLSGIE